MIDMSQPIETLTPVTEYRTALHMKNNLHMHVFLADNDIDTLSALRLLLNQQSGIKVVGQAMQVDELVTMLSEIRPDVLLLEWQLKGGVNADLIAQLRTITPFGVIVIGNHSEQHTAVLNAGADVFISKGDAPDSLLAILADFRLHKVHNRGHKKIIVNSASLD